MLTSREIADFHEDGFVCIEGVFDAGEIEALRQASEHEAIQEALRVRRSQERLVHLIPLTTRHARFRELAADPRITRRVAQLLGDDVQLYSSKLATKPLAAGAGDFAWHQDFPYFPHSHPGLVAVSVALDDVTPANGGMYALKGSHRGGVMSHVDAEGWMTGRCMVLDPDLSNPDVRPLMTARGGITLHHSLTLHCSGATLSGAPRRLAIFEYRAGSALQLAGYLWEDTGWQVHGAPSETVRCEPVAMTLPRSRQWGQHTGQVRGNAFNQAGRAAAEWNAAPVANRDDIEGKKEPT